MSYKPSKRQIAIYKAWQKTDHNILIHAVAGSGKTTVLLNILNMCDGEALYLAFNKSIQNEINSKLETNNIKYASALTMHSLGLSAVKNAYRSFEIENRKYFKMAKSVMDMYYTDLKDLDYKEKSKITMMLVNANNVSRMFLSDDYEKIVDTMKTMDMYVDSEEVIPKMWKTFVRLRDKDYKKADIEIDFTDMIYLPCKFNLKLPFSPKYLMIDESQDLNIAQHKLIDILISQGDVKRWVSVGDTKQAIYGFSGASASSFDLFRVRDNVKEYPLDICYRCPSKVIDEANKVFNVMKGFKKEEGEVKWIYDYKDIKDGDETMIVCRNTNPLLSIYFILLALEKPCYIKGDDIKNKIISFIKPLKFNKINDIVRSTLRQANILEHRNDDTSKYEASKLTECAEALTILTKYDFIDGYDKGEDLINKLNQLFRKNKPEYGICLSTIHKSKGLEADYVYILDEHLIPSKFAKSLEQKQQEYNLKYVARTRAKKALYYIESPKKEKDAKN